MKETVFDVLMYLFEHYMDDELDIAPGDDSVRDELLSAGFAETEIDKAFVWLDSLGQEQGINPAVATSFRIFSQEENNKLDADCRGLLIRLEHSGILNPTNREIVIDRVMALEDEELTLDKFKWIILMVLLSQAEDDMTFSRMENIVYDLMPTHLN